MIDFDDGGIWADQIWNLTLFRPESRGRKPACRAFTLQAAPRCGRTLAAFDAGSLAEAAF
jgi:hypothetical protein